MKNIQYRLFILIITLALGFTGCGSSSSETTEEEFTDPVTSTFVDSVVSGLSYVCSSGAEGTTTDAGEFICERGDTVSLSIGSIFLAEVTISDMMTPSTLFPNNADAALNLAQLLQTLDSDGNTSNGISIDTDILETLPSTIDFTSSTFDVDIQVALGSSITLVSETDAQTHLDETYLSLNINADGTATSTENNTPSITSASTFFVNENQTDAFTVIATDADDDTLTYTLLGDDSNSFSIDSSSGVVTFKTAPDYETKSSYSITIQVSDSSDESASQEVTVNITNLSDNTPIITSASSFTVNENETEAFTVTATDADDDALSYALLGIDVNSFNIDESSGVVTFITAPDYEDKTSYSIMPIVYDTSNAASVQMVIISINNLNDNAPIITSSATINANENQTEAFTVTSTDADENDDTISYAISGTDVSSFSIDESSGVVVFNTAPDYENKTSYTLTVTVSDTINSTNQEVNISINNLSDNAPILTSATAFSVQENQTEAFTATATDADDDTLTYAIGGTDSSSFSIDEASGEVTFNTAPDYENKDSYSLSVSVTDSAAQSDSQEVTINISDVVNPFQTLKIEEDGSSDFGAALSMSGDYAVVGGYGLAYVYKKQSDGSMMKLATLEASDAEDYDAFGYAVAIDGDYIVVGDYQKDTAGTRAGCAYVFKRNSDTNVSQIAQLFASDAQAEDQFGLFVDIDGDYIVVSAHAEDSNGDNAGSAYVFKIASDSNISQIAKIQASDAEAGDQFGADIAISTPYIVVGAENESTYGTKAGSAYVFKIASDTNVTQIAQLFASDAEASDSFGYGVDIDEDTIVIGAFGDSTGGSYAGSAYVFKIASDSNISQIAQIFASDAETNDLFAYVVAIEADTIVVGAFEESTGAASAGSAYIYKIASDNTISQITQVFANAPEEYSNFGYVVTVEGNSVLIAAPYANNYAGTVYHFDLEASGIYVYNASSSSITHKEEFTSTALFTLEAASTQSSVSYDVSGDDAGAFSMNENVLYYSPVADYENPSDSDMANDYNLSIVVNDGESTAQSIEINIVLEDRNYLLVETLVPDDAVANDTMGDAIAVSGDYTVVGASSFNSYTGVAYLYKKQSDNTMLQIAKLEASDATTGQYFGYSVAIDGDYIVVGAYQDSTTVNRAGSTYIFKRDSDSTVSQIAKLEASDAETFDYFGHAVAIDGEYIAIGAYGEDSRAESAGSAYIFKIASDSNISQIAQLTADDAQSYDFFGHSLAISGDYIVIGAQGKDTTESNAGGAYVFKIASDNNISQIATLEADNAEASDAFAFSVSIDADYIVIGSQQSDSNGSSSGSAYVFKRQSDSDISQIAQIIASDTDEYDYFGSSVSVSGAYIVVGAYQKNSSTGSAYLFEISTEDTVTQLDILQALDPQEGDNFGHAVAIDASSETIAIGARYDDTTYSRTGSMSIFIKDENQP